jgi:hypothetical protein
MKLYPYQQAMIDKLMGMTPDQRKRMVIYSGRRYGMSIFRKFATTAPLDGGLKPTCVVFDEVTDWPKRLQKGTPVKGFVCNNVLTRSKVLSKRRGRRAKRRALRKG